MFKIVENYKNLFSLFIINTFTSNDTNITIYDDSPTINFESVENKVYKIGDFYKLLDNIKSDGKITGEDLKDLNNLEEALKVETEIVKTLTKNELIKSYKDTLSKGFEVKGNEDYKVFKLLLSKISINTTIPEYEELSEIIKGNFTLIYENGKINVYNNIVNIVDFDNDNHQFGSKLIGIINNGKFEQTKVDGLNGYFDNFTFNDNKIDIDFNQIGENFENISNISENLVNDELFSKILELKSNILQMELNSDTLNIYNDLILTVDDFFKPIYESNPNIVVYSEFNDFLNTKKQELNIFQKIQSKEKDIELTTDKEKDIELTTDKEKDIELTTDKEKDIELTTDKEKDIELTTDKEKDIELTTDKEKLYELQVFYKRIGASPENKKAIQNALLNNKETLGNFGSDGKFGKVTFDAIISFQTKNHLKVDGKVGTDTLKKLGLINENQSSKDFYINTIKTNKTSENISKFNNTEKKSDLEEITLPVDKYSNIKEVDLSKDDSVTNMELDNYTSDKYETNISGESVYIESDGENTVKLVIGDLRSPTIITGVPVGKEQYVVEKYKDSLLSSLYFSVPHTYYDLMGE